jgi:hypothetical protein
MWVRRVPRGRIASLLRQITGVLTVTTLLRITALLRRIVAPLLGRVALVRGQTLLRRIAWLVRIGHLYHPLVQAQARTFPAEFFNKLFFYAGVKGVWWSPLSAGERPQRVES